MMPYWRQGHMNFYSFVLLVLVLVIVLAIVSRVRTVRRRRHQREQLQALENGFADLRATVGRLTGQIEEMHRQMSSAGFVPGAAAPAPATVRRRARQAAMVAAPTISAAPAGIAEALPEALPPPAELPAPPAPVPGPEQPEPLVSIGVPEQPPAWGTIPFKRPKPGPRQPGFIRRGLAAFTQALGRILGLKAGEPVNWEAMVGGRWLNLLGMLVLVVGIALLSQQALLYLPPLGKVAFGAGLAFAMLVGGMLLERSEAYRWIGRTLIGGGWALAYFDAYAAYNVEQAKVIDSPGLALVVLVVVAAGVIAHSLRYRAQLVTALAFGLAFLAIVLTPVTVASLVAAAVLAAGLVAVARVLSWHYLAVVGVAGTYANHWIWLQKVAAPAPVATAPVAGNWLDAALPPEAVFWLSCGILVFYWLLFSWASLRRVSDNRGADASLYLVVSVANTLGLVALLYTQVHYAFGAHYLWAVTAPVAIACAGLAFIDRRLEQRLLFLANAALSLTAFGATLPLAIEEYGWHWGWVAPYLAAGGLVTVVVGLRTRELLLRLAGYAASAIAFLNVMLVRFWEPDATSIDVLWFATLATIAAFQVAAELLRRDNLDLGYPARLFGLAAALMLAGLVWIHVPHALAAPVWMALGLALLELGLRRRSGHELQGYALMILAAGAALVVNFYGAGLDDGAAMPSWLPGWAPSVVVAAGLFYYFVRSRDAAVPPRLVPWAGDAAAALASLLVALATWKDLPSLAVAPVWAVLGLMLFEAAPRFQSPLLRVQAHIAMAAVFVRLFMANLVVDGDLAGVSFRLLTVVPVILILIYLRYQVPAAPQPEPKGLVAALLRREPALAAGLYSWASAILVVMLFRFEFGRAHTVAAWAPLLLAMLYLGRRLDDRNLRFQSYVLGAYALFRGWSTNIYLDGLWLGLDERLSTTLPMIVALLAASLLCRGAPGPAATAAPMPAGRIVRLIGFAEQHAVTYFAALGAAFLGVLLYYELPADFVSIGLALEGLVVLVSGFVLRERGYRVLGLLLLFATLVKAVFVDLAGVEEIYRIASFIILGLILLAASVGYTRYRGLIEKYL